MHFLLDYSKRTLWLRKYQKFSTSLNMMQWWLDGLKMIHFKEALRSEKTKLKDRIVTCVKDPYSQDCMAVKRVMSLWLTGQHQHIQAKAVSSLNAVKIYIIHYKKKPAIQAWQDTCTSRQRSKPRPLTFKSSWSRNSLSTFYLDAT